MLKRRKKGEDKRMKKLQQAGKNLLQPLLINEPE